MHSAFSLRRASNCLLFYIQLCCVKSFSIWYLFKSLTQHINSVFSSSFSSWDIWAQIFSVIYPKSQSQQVAEWLFYLSVPTLSCLLFLSRSYPIVSTAFSWKCFTTTGKLKELVQWSLSRFTHCYYSLYLLLCIWLFFSNLSLERYRQIHTCTVFFFPFAEPSESSCTRDTCWTI